MGPKIDPLGIVLVAVIAAAVAIPLHASANVPMWESATIGIIVAFVLPVVIGLVTVSVERLREELRYRRRKRRFPSARRR
ncbi:MAG: hypothetical protein HUJ26_18265 [Planctomycetaceae bacterium]|nr:hypothetical protein [Planctomycetaceae bacterium]